MTKLALLIGIDDYAFLSSLRYAEADATGFADALTRNYDFSKDEIVLMRAGERGFLHPSQRVVERRLLQIRDSRVGFDLLIVGFWGHGVVGCDGKRYLCPTDADETDLERTAVSLEGMIAMLAQAGAVNAALILDCCQNTVDGRSTSSTFSAKEAVATSSLLVSAREIVAAKHTERRSTRPVPTLAILNSCSAGQKAYEWDEREHGVFTAHLLDAMRARAASVGDWATYVSQKTSGTAAALFRNQTPFFKLEGAGNIALPMLPTSGCAAEERSGFDKKEKSDKICGDDVRDLGDGGASAEKPKYLFWNDANVKRSMFEKRDDWVKRIEANRYVLGRAELAEYFAENEVYSVQTTLEESTKNSLDDYLIIGKNKMALNCVDAERLYNQTKFVLLTGKPKVVDDGFRFCEFAYEWDDFRCDVNFPRLLGESAGARITLTFAGVDCAFRWVPSGHFQMGRPLDDWEKTGIRWKNFDENPFEAELTRGFWLAERPTTQKLWAAALAKEPSRFKGENRPVESVSWNDCCKFFDALGKLCPLPNGWRFDFPTEAQWEFACRAGLSDNELEQRLEETSWFVENATETRQVAEKKSNAWGFYDMRGLVWEWCADRYGVYPTGGATNPTGAATGNERVYRGGSWKSARELCCASFRNCGAEALRNSSLGVRIALRCD